ncbi:hypothetical protein FS837_003941 [Tulasnella sp. UAMH 9824]|nr:hypothetical protein FS837_003941 [Tulasnella sp. UAMH 9824]
MYIHKVASQTSHGTIRPDLEERIACFVKDLNAMAARAKEPLRAGIGRKFLMNKEYGSVVTQLNADLHRAIQEFMMKGGAATEAAVEEILQSVQAGFSATRSEVKTTCAELSYEIAGVSERVYWTQMGVQELNQHTRTWSDQVTTSLYKIDVGLTGVSDDVRRVEAAALDQRLLLLPRAHARYDSQSRQDAHGCLKGTRKKVLEEIYDWINSEDPKSPPILWLCGLAGIGKSTIAHTIAEETDADGRLGASFFFARDQAGRRNPQLVYPTIASQLARLDLELKKLIVAAVERDHEIGTLVMKKQFEKLISEPLAAWRGARGTIIIVMDALDECSLDSGAEEILIRWATELPKIPVPLKVLITSRPEFHIRRKFQSLTLRSISRPYILHDIEKSVVKEDIEMFLRHRLNQIAEDNDIQTPWPGEAALGALVDKAGILFIFASTAVKFIQNGKRKDPEARLGLVLQDSASKGGSQFREIDALYTQVLRYALSVDKEEEEEDDDDDDEQDSMQEAFGTVLGAVILLRDPLSSRSLESLLSLNHGITQIALRHLHSVLIVPESVDGEIRLLHPSFRDFLTSPKRCPDPSLHVAPPENHARLAGGCLDVLLNQLKHDPCQVQNVWLDNAEIPDLPHRLEESVPSHLRYACRHLAFHLSQASSNNKRLADLVEAFCNSQFLMWIETLSLLGEADNAIMSLRAIQDWYKNVPNPLHETLELLHDANRMVMEFGRGIRRSSGHIYTSALPFSPPCRLKRHYRQALPSNYVIRGLPNFWSPDSYTIELPAAVRSITYSCDGSMIAVGTQDGGIFIFNGLTGADIITCKKAKEAIVSVTFTPDGTRVASIAGNKAIVWDAITGALLVTLEGHKTSIQSIAFASDGINAVTGSNDASFMLSVWNSLDGNLISNRRRPTWRDWWCSAIIGLSPDTLTIARGIEDGVELWDWESDRPLKRLTRETLGCCEKVVFLKDNLRLIARSEGKHAIYVWDYLAGTLLRTVVIYGEIYISPSGSQMARVCLTSGEVQIWDTETWSIARVLIKGKEGRLSQGLSRLSSLAFSPKDNSVAFSPRMKYIQVWEDGLSHSGSTNSLHDDEVEPQALAVSADGSLAVCSLSILGGKGTQLKVWDLVNGSPPRTINFRESFGFLTCSPDGRVFMSVKSLTGVGPYIVTIWERNDLQDIATWEFDSDPCQGACFSCDGNLLATAFGYTGVSARITVLATTSRNFLTPLNGRCRIGNSKPELAFRSGNTQIMCASDLECCIWDIKVGSCLFTFDMIKADAGRVLPHDCLSEQEHILVIESRCSGSPFRIARFSAFVKVEHLNVNQLAVVRVIDGQPVFLEVRDDTLWEFSQFTERPLGWIPISWRRAFDCGDMIWSGPALVFALQGGDIGVLDIESLRRDCTSIKRTRAQSYAQF